MAHDGQHLPSDPSLQSVAKHGWVGQLALTVASLEVAREDGGQRADAGVTASLERALAAELGAGQEGEGVEVQSSELLEEPRVGEEHPAVGLADAGVVVEVEGEVAEGDEVAVDDGEDAARHLASAAVGDGAEEVVSSREVDFERDDVGEEVGPLRKHVGASRGTVSRDDLDASVEEAVDQFPPMLEPHMHPTPKHLTNLGEKFARDREEAWAGRRMGVEDTHRNRYIFCIDADSCGTSGIDGDLWVSNHLFEYHAPNLNWQRPPVEVALDGCGRRSCIGSVRSELLLRLLHAVGV